MEAKPMNDLYDELDRILADPNALENVPVFENLLKRAADLSFNRNFRNKAIYLLSESHGLNLRKQCCYEQTMSPLFTNKAGSGLDKQFIEFSNGSSYEEKYGKLLDRLRELPEEWTIVQLSLPFEPTLRLTPKKSDRAPRISKLHVVRYNCGPHLREPFHMKIKEPRGNRDYTRSIFDILYSSEIKYPKVEEDTKERRAERSDKIKAAVQEVSNGWLRHWCCLLLGRLCDKQIEQKVKINTDRIIKEYAEVIGISDSSDSYIEQIFYQIINGSAYLSHTYIKNAVAEVILDKQFVDQIVERIINLMKELPSLSSASRYPVILILDEKIECIPWEMTTVLKNHPVCRMTSIHFVYALYKAHENSVVDGSKLITNEELGYYIVNPDGSLKATEKRVMHIIKRRFPKWTGLANVKPTSKEFANALENNNFLIYCGHGSGTQYFHSDMIGKLNVRALPFLFGCSSLKLIDSGGRVSFYGLTDQYIMAGCPCVIGTMWSVTSHDTDLITLSLLNNWFSGKKVKLSVIQNFEETELLRVMVKVREDAIIYSNKAALVAYGIPVALRRSKV